MKQIGNSDQDSAIIRRYRNRYRLQDAFFGIFNILNRPDRDVVVKVPALDLSGIKKILIANAGHIGDAVISTGVLSALKNFLPEAKIGVLTGSYSKMVIESHPDVTKVHILNDWRLDRTKRNKLSLYFRYLAQRRQIIEELNAEKYDLAIDLRAWYPNFVPILYEAEIPIRIGYDRVGGRQLLTHPFKYQYDRRHELHHQLDLLGPLNLPPESVAQARPNLPLPAPDTVQRTMTTLPAGKFYILHPGSGSPIRDWPVQNWATLARYIIDRGAVPVITGRGPRDASIATRILREVPEAINLCDALSWNELLVAISKADAVVSVETSIGHIASALGTRVISLYGGMSDPLHWAPLDSRVISNHVPCFPCFNKNGCSHRACLTGISSDEVQHAVLEIRPEDPLPMHDRPI
jgi:ADP-heptose:LPS heptosyltransferase